MGKKKGRCSDIRFAIADGNARSVAQRNGHATDLERLEIFTFNGAAKEVRFVLAPLEPEGPDATPST